VRRLRQVMARPATAPSSDRWDQLVALLFPSGLTDDQRAAIASIVADREPTLSALRTVLGALDQQRAPSPVSIRWSDDDLTYATIDGMRLALDRADASVSIQIAEGAYEPHVAATLDRLLSEGDVFVDVGANVGFHTLRAAARVGADGRVIAVEANPENARLISHTVEINGLACVEVVPIALAASRGSLLFGSHIGSNGGFLAADATVSGRGTLVPTLALDDLGLDRVAVVKVDVEGAEALVVDGARTVIERDRPAFVMEFSIEMTRRVSEREPADHLQRFVDWGYRIAIIDRATAEPRPVASVDELLADWGDVVRIEDLLITPEER